MLVTCPNICLLAIREGEPVVKESSLGRLTSMILIERALTREGQYRIVFAIYSLRRQLRPRLTSVRFRLGQIYRAGVERSVIRLRPVRANLISWSP